VLLDFGEGLARFEGREVVKLLFRDAFVSADGRVDIQSEYASDE